MIKKQRPMRLIYVRSCSGEVKRLVIDMIHGQEDLIGVCEGTGDQRGSVKGSSSRNRPSLSRNRTKEPKGEPSSSAQTGPLQAKRKWKPSQTRKGEEILAYRPSHKTNRLA